MILNQYNTTYLKMSIIITTTQPRLPNVLNIYFAAFMTIFGLNFIEGAYEPHSKLLTLLDTDCLPRFTHHFPTHNMLRCLNKYKKC